METYYDILDVRPDASQEKIKEQYLFLVHAWHPDKFPNPEQKAKAEVKIREINEAYETLGNPRKRAEYERYLEQISRRGAPAEEPIEVGQPKAGERQPPAAAQRKKAAAQEEKQEALPVEEKGRLYWALEGQLWTEIEEEEKHRDADIEEVRRIQQEMKERREQERQERRKKRLGRLRWAALVILAGAALAAGTYWLFLR